MIVCISHAKVGYRQTIFSTEKPGLERAPGFFIGSRSQRVLAPCSKWTTSPAVAGRADRSFHIGLLQHGLPSTRDRYVRHRTACRTMPLSATAPTGAR